MRILVQPAKMSHTILRKKFVKHVRTSLSALSSSAVNCLKCVDSNYYLDDGACKICNITIGCYNCFSATNCSKCIDNRFFLKEGVCVLCNHIIEGCLTCLGEKECESCDYPNYFLDIEKKKCENCKTINNCKNCISKDVCLGCISSEFYLT